MLWDIPIIAWLALAGLLVTALVRRAAIARSADKAVTGMWVCNVARCKHRNEPFAQYCAKCGSPIADALPKTDSSSRPT